MAIDRRTVRVFGVDHRLRTAVELGCSADRRLMTRLLADAGEALADDDLEAARVPLRRVVRMLLPTLPAHDLNRLATIQYVQILEVSNLVGRSQTGEPDGHAYGAIQGTESREATAKRREL